MLGRKSPTDLEIPTGDLPDNMTSSLYSLPTEALGKRRFMSRLTLRQSPKNWA
jgi:hypothetical protein